ncbi:hypothetical protein D3C84_482240 [compost metagenome]
MADKADGIGHGFAHQRCRGCGHDHAQCGEQEHGQRQTDDLPDNLVLLAFGIAAEVRDVQRQGCPEADHGGQPGEEVTVDTRAFRALGRLCHQLAQRHIGQRPHQQASPHQYQQGRGQGFQPLDRLGTAQHHQQVQPPEQHETDDLAGTAKAFPVRRQGAEEQVDGQPAEHGLDTKPAAGYQGAD